MSALQLAVPGGMRMADWSAFSSRFKELIATEKNQTVVAKRLGYSTPRIGQMARGEKPSRSFVERLIERYDLDRDEWLGLAGMGPQANDPTAEMIREAAREAAFEVARAVNGPQRLYEGLVDLQERYPGQDVPLPRMHGGAVTLTVEEAESILADLEDKMRRGIV